mgnify:CR=1 FL=1
MDRSQRLLSMLVALQANRQMTAAELAEEFGVSTRTVLRDVETLAAAEVPVVAQRGRYGGITLLVGAEIDVGRLTNSEAEVLELIGVDLPRARKLGIEAAARSAARKLTGRRRMPSATHGDTQLPLTEVVSIDNSAWFAPDEPSEVAALTRDIRRGRSLSIEYRSSGHLTTRSRTVEPYGVLSRGGRWYLIADTAGQPRMFALSRLTGWTVLADDRSTRPGVSLADVIRELAVALEGRHELIVTADLDADREDLARRILGSRLLSAIRTDNPETVRITVGFDQLDGVRQLLQFGDHFEVVDPPEARALIERLAAMITDRHRDQDLARQADRTASGGGSALPRAVAGGLSR